MEENEKKIEEIEEQKQDTVEETDVKVSEAKGVKEEKPLTDDELYTKIQTEKLITKKKKRRFATICGMCIAFVFAVAMIIMATVPVSLKPRCLQDGFYQVQLYHGINDGGSFFEGDARYDEFMKKYNKAFSQTFLSALFSGSLFSYEIQENTKNVDSVLGELGSLVGSNSYFVKLQYDEDHTQTLTNQNGKAYRSLERGGSWDGIFKFTEAYFVVNETAGIQDTDIYVVTKRPTASSEITVLIQITVKADTYEIFKAWDDLA